MTAELDSKPQRPLTTELWNMYATVNGLKTKLTLRIKSKLLLLELCLFIENHF